MQVALILLWSLRWLLLLYCLLSCASILMDGGGERGAPVLLFATTSALPILVWEAGKLFDGESWPRRAFRVLSIALAALVLAMCATFLVRA